MEEKRMHIIGANVLRWYGLSFRFARKGEPPAIVVSIYEKCVEVIQPLLAIVSNRYASAYADQLGGLFYETDLSVGFGFDRALHFKEKSKGYLHLSMPLGDGHKYSLPARAASLSVLFLTLGQCIAQNLGDPKRTQLMTIDSWFLTNQEGRNIFALGGNTSPAFTQWVTANYNKPKLRERAVKAMYHAEKAFFPKTKTSRGSMGAFGYAARFDDDGRFFLQCPGNACDISTESTYSRPGEVRGYRFSPHNLDTSAQQLELIAGLAALHGLAAKELDKK